MELQVNEDITQVDDHYNEMVNCRQKPRMYACSDYLFNCVVVLIPSILIFPIFIWILKHFGFLKVPPGSDLENTINLIQDFIFSLGIMIGFIYLIYNLVAQIIYTCNLENITNDHIEVQDADLISIVGQSNPIINSAVVNRPETNSPSISLVSVLGSNENCSPPQYDEAVNYPKIN